MGDTPELLLDVGRLLETNMTFKFIIMEEYADSNPAMVRLHVCARPHESGLGLHRLIVLDFCKRKHFEATKWTNEGCDVLSAKHEENCSELQVKTGAHIAVNPQRQTVRIWRGSESYPPREEDIGYIKNCVVRMMDQLGLASFTLNFELK